MRTANLEWYTTASHHPAANGMAGLSIKPNAEERAFTFSALDHSTGGESIQWATLAINTSYQSTIEEIPCFLFHSRDADIPLAKLIQTPKIDNYLGKN